jgi:hypothetical protein
MKYNYATDVAAGACPDCGQPVILYHHVQLTTGEERRNVTVLDSIFCRDCIAKMIETAEDAYDDSAAQRRC